MSERIRLVIVEDEHLYLDLLEAVLRQDPSLDVVGAFSSGATALERIPRLGPDVALLDIELGGEPNGVQLGLLLRRDLRELGIVLLSDFASPRLLDSLPEAELRGWSYLLKRSVRDAATLRRSIQAAAAGLVSLDPLLVARREPSEDGPLARLTPRQREILELLAQGWTNDAIAERLALATRTVENQLVLLYQELGVDRATSSLHPRVKAVLLYLQDTRQLAPSAGSAA